MNVFVYLVLLFRKQKYTKDDLESAVAAVNAGQTLGKASKEFNVPKETLRQAKLKCEQNRNSRF